MVKLTVLYGHPTDTDAFDGHYADTHAPLAERIPKLERFEAGRVSTPDGSEPPYDIPNFATGGVTVFSSEVEG